MKFFLLASLLLLIQPLQCYSNPTNVKISSDGKIESIQFKSISEENNARILAQLVADDVLKLSDKLAAEKKFMEAHSLSASVVYLDMVNKTALRKSANYLKHMINDDSSKKKIYKDFLNESKAGLKNTNSIHKLQVEISLILAEEARDLYPSDSLEYKNANEIITKYKNPKMSEEEIASITKKLSEEAFAAQGSGDFIKAINKYSVLYFATNNILPLIRISEILQSEL